MFALFGHTSISTLYALVSVDYVLLTRSQKHIKRVYSNKRAKEIRDMVGVLYYILSVCALIVVSLLLCCFP